MIDFSAFPGNVPVSKDYRVFVNGTEAPVYTCRISAYPINRVWPGYQRSESQTEPASYVNLVTDEAVRIEVEPLSKTAYERILLKPYAKEVAVEKIGNRIAFTLTEQGGYVLELDDYHGLLYLFNNKPVPCEPPETVTYYFGKGIHNPGKIILKSNESIYLDKDALVFGCVFAEGEENLRVYGNGIFDDTMENRPGENFYEQFTNGNLKFYDCKNVRIEGVGLANSAIWCVNLFHCFDVEINRINVFGQWRYNTDGVDIVNCRRITVRDSFIHSFDDTVTIKGIDKYSFESNTDILVENCVLICDWGKTMEIGLETECDEYRDITFRGCHVIRGGNTVCDIQNGDRALIHGIVFEDFTMELERFYTPEVYQNDDSQTYDRKDETLIASLLRIKNPRFREMEAYLSLGLGTGDRSKAGTPDFAAAKDVTVRNARIYCDEALLRTKGTECVNIQIDNRIPTTVFEKITVENVTVNGKKIGRDGTSVSIKGCDESILTVK